MGKRDKRKPKQSPSKGDQEFTDQPAQHGFWLPGHGGEGGGQRSLFSRNPSQF